MAPHSALQKPKSTIRFFDRNEYYSVHGDDDAKFTATNVFKTINVINVMSNGRSDESKGLPYVILSKNQFESWVRDLLLVLHYRVEVYVQKERSTQEWEIEYRGSPGNLIQFEDLLYNNRDVVANSSLIAVFLKTEDQQKNLGIACLDTNRIFHVLEFVDDDFYTELETIAVVLSPQECLLPSTEGEYEKIKTVLERNGILVTRCKSSEFKMESLVVRDNLKQLMRFNEGQAEDISTIPEINLKLAMASLCAAINYLNLIQDAENAGQYKMQLIDLKRFVHLDAAAVSALNLFPKKELSSVINAKAKRWSSILGVLDYCKTTQGHRNLIQWLKQPLRNLDAIIERHDIVETFTNNSVERQDLREGTLKYMPDLMMLTSRLIRKKAILEDIYKLYQAVENIPTILSLLEGLNNSSVKSILHDPLKDSLKDLINYKNMVEQVLDFSSIEERKFNIKPEFDEELAELRNEVDRAEEKMQRELLRVCEDLDINDNKTIKLDFVSHIGYFFRMTAANENKIRSRSEYIVHDSTAVKGAVRFGTKNLKIYSDDIKGKKEEFEEAQQKIVDEVTRIALGYSSAFMNLNQLIAQIDVFTSLATAAVSAPTPYVRPKMLPEGSGVLKLTKVRHPCIELQDDVCYIANDLCFEKDNTNMYVITGPNCGGKSTFIRSCGVSVLLAHIGSFVPCDSAEISVVDAISSRVGADDDLNKGLSTFMVEMIETAGIIRTATDKSLVIIDELGRGTSTYDGCGLAYGIAEHLATEKKCMTLFATHFHEITNLSKTCSTVQNFHMLAMVDDENFTILYQLVPGVVEKSFGIQVAKLAGFPEQVVKSAQRIYEDIDEQLEYKLSEDEIKANLDRMKGKISDDDYEFVLKQLTANKF